MSDEYDKNNTNFPIQIYDFLSRRTRDKRLGFLKDYQDVPRSFVREVIPRIGTRGMLMYHGMGTGKSLLSVSIAMDRLEDGRTRKVLYVLSKSLVSNMKQTIQQYVQMRSQYDPQFTLPRSQLRGADVSDTALEQWVNDHFVFVALNAPNMLEQLTRTVGKMLNGYVVIVDEAHNLFRSIINGSKNGSGFYELTQQSRNYLLIFLSGTPIANDPFEISACFNMLEPGILPSNYYEFSKYFVGPHKSARNSEKFKNRIFGMVSHVSGRHLKSMPDNLSAHVHFVPMSQDQHARYMMVRDMEKSESQEMSGDGRAVKDTPTMQKPSDGASGSYRSKSRQVSNYAPPTEMGRQFKLSDIPDEQVWSPKLESIYENIRQSVGKVMVYSEFVGAGGVGALHKYMRHRDPNMSMVFITGSESTDERRRSLDRFNASQNKRGEQVKVLLVSAAGAEGLNLRSVREVHVMEPYWTLLRVIQVLYRAIRDESHNELPTDERNVRLHMYISLENKRSPNKENWDIEEINEARDEHPSTDSLLNYLHQVGGEEGTTETMILTTSIRDYMGKNQHLSNLISAGIECRYMGKDGCKVCAPTGKRLYSPYIVRDMAAGDPCETYEQQTVRAQQLTHNGITYYYVQDPNSLYGVKLYKPYQDKYAEITPDENIFDELIEKI